MEVTRLTSPDPVAAKLRHMYISKFAEEYREANKAEYYSKSPYAPTNKEPGIRLVDNALVEGEGHTSPVSTSSRAVRGFFGGVKGVVNNTSGGGGSWRLDSRVQFDKVFTCPITNREFSQADMDDYKRVQQLKCKAEVANRLADLVVRTEPGTTGFLVQYGDTTHEVSYERVMSWSH